MRVKCPMCGESTDTLEGHCQFCGGVVDGERADESMARAAAAAAAAPLSPGTYPGADPARPIHRASDATRDAGLALVLSLVGFFLFPPVAPLGWIWGLRARRALVAENSPTTAATAAVWIGGFVTLLGVFVILVILYLLASGGTVEVRYGV